MLIYYTEFMLFGIYFMLFHVMSSDSRLILLSACGEHFHLSFIAKKTSPEKMSNLLSARPASEPGVLRECYRQRQAWNGAFWT